LVAQEAQPGRTLFRDEEQEQEQEQEREDKGKGKIMEGPQELVVGVGGDGAEEEEGCDSEDDEALLSVVPCLAVRKQ
jgi:hypothetical protein